MSVNSTAYAVYGGVFNYEDIRIIKNVRTCSHPETGSKFCPECGKPMWQERKEEAFDSAYDIGDIGYVRQEHHDEVAVGIVMNRISGYGDDWVKLVPVITDKHKEELALFCTANGIEMPEPGIVLVMTMG